ncbi:MAG: sugar ABC transporter permease [Clostridiales bacterium]|nr:sugar ABC transporter permease [Clostridiales bacterium]
MASPAILGFFLFTIGPLLASLVLSFTDYSVTNQFEFIGLDNFKRLFSGEDVFFFKSLGVTFYYVLLSVPVGLVSSFFLALLLKPKIPGRSFFRVLLYIPCIVPAIATATIFVWLLNPDIGLFNQILRALHLPTSQFIYSEQSVVPTLAFMNIWTSGSTMLIFLASLEDIPIQYYEAVDVDGGNSFHKLLHITLPMMTPTIFFNLVMGIINGFQTFTQAFVMTEGGPNNASLFYSVYLYREAFTSQRMASACALAWVLFVIIFLLSLLVFRSSNFWVHYEGDR